MNKLMAGFILTAATFSGAVLANSNNSLSLDVMPQRGGAWVTVEKGGVPQPGLDVIVEGARKHHYTTSESGRVFVYSAFEASRSMTFEVADENGKTFSTKHFIPSNRS